MGVCARCWCVMVSLDVSWYVLFCAFVVACVHCCACVCGRTRVWADGQATWAIYCLITFYLAMQEEIEKSVNNALGKFLCVKAVVFLCFYQVCLSHSPCPHAACGCGPGGVQECACGRRGYDRARAPTVRATGFATACVLECARAPSPAAVVVCAWRQGARGDDEPGRACSHDALASNTNTATTTHPACMRLVTNISSFRTPGCCLYVSRVTWSRHGHWPRHWHVPLHQLLMSCPPPLVPSVSLHTVRCVARAVAGTGPESGAHYWLHPLKRHLL